MGDVQIVTGKEFVCTPYILSNDDASVYADGAQGGIDPNGLEGWYFENTADPANKINWYFINNFGIDSDMNLASLDGMYCLAVIYNPQEFFFQVYTKRKNDGNDASWYRSRITYLTTGEFANYIGQRVLVYWGKEPTDFPELPRIKMDIDAFTTVGPQEYDEEIFLGSLSTSTGYAASTYSFTAQALGFINNNRYHNFPLLAKFDASALNLQISNLQAYLTAVETGRFFRGYVADQTEMDALASPLQYQYVVRVDTETIWEYNGATWVDTLVTASLTGIGDQDQQAAGYSNTHYIDLDGTNDYVDLDTGVNANVLDYTQSWALGFEVENVSAIDDSSYTTLWKRGDNEITLRKGGSNWGVYFYANGNSVGQANTWRRPEPGSKILFICNGSQVKYYLYRPSNGEIYNATMTLNATNVTNHNNPSGNLEIGQMGAIGSNWFGGINNALIMEGAGSDLGANQRAEYFGSQDVTLMSFYNDPEVQDFLPLGEDTYPAVTGTKSVISGNLINGTASDFVARP